MLSSVPARASAQADSYQYRPTYQAFEQRAYDNGFREGLTQGEQDARLRREFSFARNQEKDMPEEIELVILSWITGRDSESENLSSIVDV